MTTITLDYADYKFERFAMNVRNSAPTSMYSEDWLNKMLDITTKATAFGVSDKINFSDRRLMLIAYKAMLKVSLKTIEIDEWAIIRGYFEYYSDETKQIKNDVRDFITAYISNNFGLEELSDNQIKRMNELKDSILSYNLNLPDFFQRAIAKEEVPEYDEEVIKKWSELREYCEMIIADARSGKKEKIKCERLLISCQLFL